MSETQDELDGLFFATTDRGRLLGALTDDAAEEGLLPVSPKELAPYGRWPHRDEDPTVRRHVVAPSSGGWIAVFSTPPDWDHDRAPALAERLGCRAVSLMLHDGDVLSLHAFEATGLVASYFSSPVHFDLPPRPEGELGFDPATLLPFCRPGTTAPEVEAALTPPGRIDVDGRRAWASIAGLLGLGPHAGMSHALLLDPDGLSLRRDLVGFDHLAFQLEDDDDDGPDDEPPWERGADSPAEPLSGRVLHFPARRPPRA